MQSNEQSYKNNVRLRDLFTEWSEAVRTISKIRKGENPFSYPFSQNAILSCQMRINSHKADIDLELESIDINYIYSLL